MEREGEGREVRGRRKGRRGGEMRKGIVIGGMVLSLLMGCNNGVESSAVEKGLNEVAKSAEGVFYKFIELVSGSLGFTVTKETTRTKVTEYFTELAKKIGKVIESLQGIESHQIKPGDEQKAVSVGKSNQEQLESARSTLITLKGYIEALKDIGDSNKVVEVSSSQSGVAADQAKLEAIYDALKGIVDIAKKEGVEEPRKSELTVVNTSLGGSNPENGAKVLTAGAAAGAAAGPEAATIVSAVSGKEILAAIVGASKGDASATISGNVDGSTSALKFAKGGSTASHFAQTTALAGAVSGGIALRSLVKGGKLASHSSNDEKAVQSAGITAVNKLLGAVENIIMTTVKKTLEKVKEAIDTTKNSKTVAKSS